MISPEGKISPGVPKTDAEHVRREYTFLTQTMMGMMTHPHAKPAEVTARDATHLMAGLRIVKEPDEIARIRRAGAAAAERMRTAAARAAHWQPAVGFPSDRSTSRFVGAPGSRLCGGGHRLQ